MICDTPDTPLFAVIFCFFRCMVYSDICCFSADVAKQIICRNCGGRLAQLARALRLHRGCQGFESLIAHKIEFLCVKKL